MKKSEGLIDLFFVRNYSRQSWVMPDCRLQTKCKQPEVSGLVNLTLEP